MSRVLAYGCTLGVAIAVLWPGLGSPDADSYPLSTYPMFARRRGKPWLDVAEGINARGEVVRIPPELVASGEVMQAAATVRRAVRGGVPTLAALCARIAERAKDHATTREVTAIRIVGARFDPIAYFEDGPEPEARTVHYRCEAAP